MEPTALLEQIEKHFAEATPQNVRYVSRQLERLVRQLPDPALRKRYEAAIDQLPDMVAHLDNG
ncbi:MAG TPA: hypothetical protein V6D47_11490 [Oscillatoriaceae cyanobacterium]